MKARGLNALGIAAFLAWLSACGVMGTEVGNGLKPGDKESGRKKETVEAAGDAKDAPQADKQNDEKQPEPMNEGSKSSEGANSPASTTSDGAAPAQPTSAAEHIFNLVTAPCLSPWSESLAKAPRLERVEGTHLTLSVTLGAGNAVQIVSSTGLSRTLTRQDGAELKPVSIVGDDRFRDYAAANYRCGTVTTDTNVSSAGRSGLVRRTVTISEAGSVSQVIWYLEGSAEAGKVNLVRLEVVLKGIETTVFEHR